MVEEVGAIRELSRQRGGLLLRVAARKVLSSMKVNNSIAINGACVTVASRDKNTFQVLAVEETLKKTALDSLKNHSKVNLERPLTVSDRLGGHLVIGHVDCAGLIQKIVARKRSWMFTIAYPQEFSRYVIPVGSIAVDGVSLTVADVRRQSVSISIIPNTWKKTIFQFYQIGDKVNLEFDVLGKYIERWILMNPEKSSLRSLGTYLTKLKRHS